MNFGLTEEQQLLEESVNKYVNDRFDLEKRRALEKSELGFEEENWNTLAELGWLALPFSEEMGGLGGDAVDLSILMNGVGKGLLQEPILGSIVLTGTALRAGANEQQAAQYVGPLLDGAAKGALAFVELQSRYNFVNVMTDAKASGESFVINGKKSMVLNANCADFIIVSARTAGQQSDDNGISLFIIDPSQEGVSLEHYPTVDGLQASELILENVTVSASQLLGELDKGASILQAALNEGVIAVSAEAVGAMEVLYQETADYAQQRIQFDHPLSEFQVVKHRLVDMFMQTEQAKALQERASREYAEDPQAAQRTVHALKVLIGQSGRFVGENAVQLHGGMGMTEELKIGHYFKRLTVINALFGDEAYHFDRFMELQQG